MTGVLHVEIKERAEELKDLMNRQSKATHRKRLQALNLLKSGQCPQVIQAAAIIGHHRTTIHRWLEKYNGSVKPFGSMAS